jgi:hypothetical protein
VRTFRYCGDVEVIRFLRHIFGRKQPVDCDDQTDDGDYDADTQEMILSSFDLLEHLENKGEDLKSERVIHHFFVGNHRDIQRASRLFESQGFLVEIKEDNRLHIVERCVLSISWVQRTIPFMLQTSGEFDLEYDGWDCGQTLGPNDQLFIR